MHRSCWIEKLPRGYSVRFYDGQGKKQRIWTPSYQAAQVKKLELKSNLVSKAQGDGELHAVPIEVFESRYIPHLIHSDYRAGTVRIKRFNLSDFLKSCSKMSEINAARIRNFRDSALLPPQSWSSTTVNMALRDLRAFLRWCVREQIITANPFVDIDMPRSKQRGRNLKEEEIQAIYDCADPIFKSFLLFLIFTGARSNEIRMAKWLNVDVKRGTWFIPESDNKSRKSRTVPLTGKLLTWARSAPKTGTGPFESFNKYSARWFLQKALKKSKIAGRVTIHDFRHSFASKWTGRPVSLMNILGWKSMSMLQRYSHLTHQDLREEMTKNIGAKLGQNDVTS